MNRGAWSEEEDKFLLRLVKKHGKKWGKLSQLMRTRNCKQIRDRYINNLDPSINREKFTENEDEKIFEMYKKNGNSWCKIAKISMEELEI